MECPSCKANLPDDSQFCDECGAPMPIGCPSCGASNRSGAKFCTSCGRRLTAGASTAEAMPAGSPAPQSARPAPSAERRQLTVMFCDLVGSTALASRLDPEDLREVIDAYHRCVANMVGRYDGFVAKLMGDGVLAYFGYPQAHEDDAERAVRVGVAIVDAVPKLATPAKAPLALRVGIATGLVVVGDLVGEGMAQEDVVVGETPNLAARLQARAEPGGVVIAEGTRRLLGSLFDLADLGAMQLKGFAAPVRTWRVVGESIVDGRFEALHGFRLAPLVDRDQEVGLLLDRWQRAKDGEGQVVLLSGEPGIGKSRIMLALSERLRSEERISLRYQGSPYYTNSALYPFFAQIERAAGLGREDPAEIKLAKLATLLGQAIADTTSSLPLLAEHLAIPIDGRAPTPDLAPEQKKMKLFDVLLSYIEGLAAKHPLLMSAEDAHWFDPTSLELFDVIVERIERLPVLLVITFRPDFALRWMRHPHATLLTLNRLGRSDGTALIGHVTGGRVLPTEILAEILGKTEGVPLFIEELTKTVVESGLLREAAAHYVLDRPLPPLAIPTTLQDSLMARLDRLGQAKEVAQLGAVLGREFSYDVLAAVSTLKDNELRSALNELAAAELIFRRGSPPQATYVFKHALVQQAAYASLLRSKRHELHSRIASLLERQLLEGMAVEPELLAHHYTKAEQTQRAVDYWLKAGERADQRSATREAINHLKKGLELLQTLPDTAERARLELGFQSALGASLIAIRGDNAPETGKAYARARELCERLGATTQLLPVLFGQWAHHVVRAENRTAWQLAEQFSSLAQTLGEGGPIVVGHRIRGYTLTSLGKLAPARTQFDQVLSLYDANRDRSLAFRYGQDQQTSALAFMGLALWLLGYPEQAVAARDKAINWAKGLDHVNTVAYSLYAAALLDAIRREPESARSYVTSLVAFAHEKGLALWLSWGMAIEGWVLAVLDHEQDGIVRLCRILAELRAAGASVHMTVYLALLTEAYAALGQTEAGLSVLGEALTLVEQTEERLYEAELLRLKGELLLTDHNDVEVISLWRRALEVARRQEAKSLELRVATSLARLLAGQGQRQQAYDVLAPIYGWFAEGLKTADLRDAKTLLDNLFE